MTSIYPNGIDGYAEIRLVRDRIDEIVADDINDVRSAVIAVEQTLGTNPQGAFGTVTSRLNDAYNNIAAHVNGAAPRHPDTVIESAFKSGSVFNLTAGNVGSQLQDLLDTVNTLNANDITTLLGLTDTPSTFAGSANRFAKVNSGATALEFDTASFIELSDTPSSLAGHGSKLVKVNAGATALEFVTAAAGVTDFVDLSDVPSSYSGQANQFVRVNTGETGLEFTAPPSGSDATYLTRAFDTFVTEGMAVTQNGGGPNWDITAGFIHGNGFLARYDGATNVAPAGAGTNYVYATINSSGTVVVSVSTSAATAVGDSINPQVLIHTFTHAGGAWSADQDLRRYGILTNNKNYFTVGSDGFGADFDSLKTAVEHVRILNSAGTKDDLLKIILADDISITSTSEMDILLSISGIEIDGAGRTISVTNADAAIFNVIADNIHIHNINAVWNFTSAPSSACLAKIADGADVSNVIIESCIQTDVSASNSNRVPYFVRCGTFVGTSEATGLMLLNNTAQVNKAGLNFQRVFGSIPSANSSVISNNRFYQAESSSNWLATAEPCIRAGDFCVVDGNLIEGGFNSGIELEINESSIVSNNVINGGTGTSSGAGTPLMVTGIGLDTAGLGASTRCIISDNIIKGITTIGIDDRISGGFGANVMISGNMIDNTFDNSNTMVGIQGRGVDTHIVGNLILDPGDHGIENSSVTIGNQIANGLATFVSAIEVTSNEGMVANNYIYNCPGIGIDLSNSDACVVSGNYLEGTSLGTTGILDAGDNCAIVGNIIKTYGASSGFGISTDSGGGITGVVISSNTIVDPDATMTAGIQLSTTNSDIIISNNIIGDATTPLTLIGIDLNSAARAVVSGNCIQGNDVLHASGGGIMTVGEANSITGNVIDGSSNLGIDLVNGAGNAPSDSVISSNVIRTGTSDGIRIGGGNNYMVIGNKIEDTDNFGIRVTSSARALVIAHNSIDGPNSGGLSIEAQMSDSIIANNSVDNPNGEGIIFVAASSSFNCLVVGNYIRGGLNTTVGIDIGNGNNKTAITGNFVQNVTTFGIQCDSVNCTIIGNHINEPTLNGIYLLTNALENAIIGNHITDAGSGSRAISSEATSNVHIASNCIVGVSIRVGTGIRSTSTNTSVASNYVHNCSTGVQLTSAADNSLVMGNYVDDHNANAFQLSSIANIAVVGNANANPGVSSDGIDVGFSTDVLLTGNRMVVQSGNDSFLITSPNTEVTAAGNLGKGGNTPTDFGTSHGIDTGNCNRVA